MQMSFVIAIFGGAAAVRISSDEVGAYAGCSEELRAKAKEMEVFVRLQAEGMDNIFEEDIQHDALLLAKDELGLWQEDADAQEAAPPAEELVKTWTCPCCTQESKITSNCCGFCGHEDTEGARFRQSDAMRSSTASRSSIDSRSSVGSLSSQASSSSQSSSSTEAEDEVAVAKEIAAAKLAAKIKMETAARRPRFIFFRKASSMITFDKDGKSTFLDEWAKIFREEAAFKAEFGKDWTFRNVSRELADFYSAILEQYPDMQEQWEAYQKLAEEAKKEFVAQVHPHPIPLREGFAAIDEIILSASAIRRVEHYVDAQVLYILRRLFFLLPKNQIFHEMNISNQLADVVAADIMNEQELQEDPAAAERSDITLDDLKMDPRLEKILLKGNAHQLDNILMDFFQAFDAVEDRGCTDIHEKLAAFSRAKQLSNIRGAIPEGVRSERRWTTEDFLPLMIYAAKQGGSSNLFSEVKFLAEIISGRDDSTIKVNEDTNDLISFAGLESAVDYWMNTIQQKAAQA